MRILGVIPARGGSKGVPRKNLREVGGLPLIVHSIRTARAVSGPGLPHRRDYRRPRGGAGSPGSRRRRALLRPAELARDGTPMLPVVRHALEFVERADRTTVDWVLLLQPTNPFRRREDVVEAVALAGEGKCDSVISVVRVYAVHPLLMKRIEDGYMKPFGLPEPEGTRRQDYDPPAYMRNGAIYLTRREVILGGSMWGSRSRPYEMPEDRSVGIDSELDLRLADLLMRDKSTPRSR